MGAVISWSGGKDSCLAHWRARQMGIAFTHTLTALDETGQRTRSHGVSRRLIEAQVASVGLTPAFLSASWSGYEAAFIAQLSALQAGGVETAVFGDIDIAAHREWEEKVCAQAGLGAVLPLWQRDRLALVREFLDAGFKARIVCVDGRTLDQSFAGREFDRATLADLPVGVDACGENGEFHTFVYDGPTFRTPIPLQSCGTHAYVASQETGGHTYYFHLLDLG